MQLIELPGTSEGPMLVNVEAIMLVRKRYGSEGGSVVVLMHEIQGSFGPTRELGTTLTPQQIEDLIRSNRVR